MARERRPRQGVIGCMCVCMHYSQAAFQNSRLLPKNPPNSARSRAPASKLSALLNRSPDDGICHLLKTSIMIGAIAAAAAQLLTRRLMSSSTLAQAINVSHKEITLAKTGIKHAGLHRRGQAWFCTTGLPSDVTVEVDEMAFHLHKFPLISRSGRLSELIAEASGGTDEDDESDSDERVCSIRLPAMPGGSDAFEQVAKFCYGVKIEISAGNVATLRCAADYLRMTEEYGERNLVSLTEGFLHHVILTSWKNSVTVLASCEALLPLAEQLSLVKKCVNAIVSKVCADPRSLRSPDGTLLWNGISTGARLKRPAAAMDWWMDDIALLSLPLLKVLISCMDKKGVKAEVIARALMHYSKTHIPGLSRRQEAPPTELSSARGAASPSTLLPSEAEQVLLLETIEGLLPQDPAAIPTSFLFGLLKVAMIISASEACKANLEQRIAAQLDQATVDDLLIPNYSYSTETLYDVDCVHRLMQQFLSVEKVRAEMGRSTDGINGGTPQPTSLPSSSPPLNYAVQPLRDVARLLDAYLGEIAPDLNLKPGKFQGLAESLPHNARELDDGLYRAIDVFIKAHSWMTEEEREALCSVIDCRKLSLEACTHATQNERLPLRVVVQVLFVEQMQLRMAIMGCLEDSTASRPSATTTSDVLEAAGMPPRREPTPPARQDFRYSGSEVLGTQDCLAARRRRPIHRSSAAMARDVSNENNPHIVQADSLQSGAISQQPGILSAQESHALRTDMMGLRRRISELERECSRLHHRLRHKASGWASLSSKLTCRSIADVSDASAGALQQPKLSRSLVTIQPLGPAHGGHLAESSLHPPQSYSSSSTQSFYSPSPHKESRQSFFLSPKV